TGRAFLHSINTHINNATLMHVNTFTHHARADAPSNRDDNEPRRSDLHRPRGRTSDRDDPSTDGEVERGSTRAETSIGNGSQDGLGSSNVRVDQQEQRS